MKKIFLVYLLSLLFMLSTAIEATALTFDKLPEETNIESMSKLK